MKKLFTTLVVMLMVLAMGIAAHATVSSVTGLNGTYTKIYNVTFSADTDTYGSVTHSLGGTATEYEYQLTPIDANCLVGINTGTINVVTAMPYVNDISSTSIGIAKNSVTSSATCAVRVMVRRVHSIIQ